MELQTALALVAPHDVQALVVPLLKHYSPELLVVFPAHISVLYPFVPPDRLEDACETLRTLCADVTPFEITLAGYDRFPGTTFLNPVNPTPIHQLYAKIHARFPDYLPYGGAFGPDIHPHMTVAQFKTEADQQQAVFPPYAPVTFLARRLHVLSGPSTLDRPWLTEAVIPFGL
ncbi:MAG TPA: 2'-5' RNA ligase family protein [Aggregatilineaceae bacterium]|nr:2'-5' RNA ligase family protein [Aggregatilineaceae bacterium]